MSGVDGANEGPLQRLSWQEVRKHGSRITLRYSMPGDIDVMSSSGRVTENSNGNAKYAMFFSGHEERQDRIEN